MKGVNLLIAAPFDGFLRSLIKWDCDFSSAVGFGSVVKVTPAFMAAVDFMTSLPGNPLIGSAIAVSVIAGMTGSASGGQAIALPLLAPHYLDIGVNPEALHRVVAISSGTIDSLPHGGTL